MTESIVIIGASPFSSMMRCYLEEEEKYRIIAYSVEKAYLSQAEFDGKPLVPLEKLGDLYPASQYRLLNSLGYIKCNSVRERLFHFCKQEGYSFITYVHPSAIVNSPLGEGCIVLEKSIVGYRNKVGDGCLIYSGVNISHDCNVGDFTYWAPGAIACGNVIIGKSCFIGAGAVLRNRIHIANECVVGAGVYMNRSIDEVGSVYRAPYPVLHHKKSNEIF